MRVRVHLIAVVFLIVLVSVISLIVSIYLAISYIRYNRKENSIGKTGEEIARKILDQNNLNHIKVSATGSILFGNSYSHYFKKVRLRRMTYKKKSVSSMAMAAQKSALAILDKEKDPDMKKRIKLVPLITFGPFAFIPLVLIGAVLDMYIYHSDGVCTIACAVFGLLFYLFSFFLSVTVLKTEKKAQLRAIELMRNDAIANEEEIVMVQKLFKLYNIEYINNMILALLELIYRILQIVAMVSNQSSSSSKS